MYPPGSGTSASPYYAADSAWYLGCKLYEIGNHLGNVVPVISDRKQAFDTDMDDAADYYEPVVLSATDYYPFGFEMPGRKYNIGDYRYGFNGKEADRNKEWASLVHYDYGFRIYNPALGRFLSVDPLTREYPWYTPYQFAGNSPILYLDLDGREPVSAFKEYLQPQVRGHVIIVVETEDNVRLNTLLQQEGISRNMQHVINEIPPNSDLVKIEYQSFSIQNSVLSRKAWLGPIVNKKPYLDIVPISILASNPLDIAMREIDVKIPQPPISPDPPVTPINNVPDPLTFRGRTITPKKPLSYHERVRTGLYNPSISNKAEARRQLRDLARFLNENPRGEALILGNFHLNAGGPEKDWSTRYSEETRRTKGIPSHIKDFGDYAISRARNVVDFLINEFGVNPDQLKFEIGKQYTDAERGQSVTIDVRAKK